MKDNSRKLHRLLLPLGALALGASLMAAPAVRQQDPQQPAPDNTKRNKDQTDPSADQQKMNPADRAITQKIRKAIHDDKNLSPYAHNIKNLLVRPNDLLGRCLDDPQLPADQEQMLREVRQTLGTVTERLQQILRTVRRDPSKAELTRIDLNALVARVIHEHGQCRFEHVSPGGMPSVPNLRALTIVRESKGVNRCDQDDVAEHGAAFLAQARQ